MVARDLDDERREERGVDVDGLARREVDEWREECLEKV